MKKLSLVWTKHLKTDEERREFEKTVRHDTLVLGRLEEIIQEKLSGLENREVSLDDYNNPSWAYKQAHMNGIRKGLTEILDLLKISS